MYPERQSLVFYTYLMSVQANLNKFQGKTGEQGLGNSNRSGVVAGRTWGALVSVMVNIGVAVEDEEVIGGNMTMQWGAYHICSNCLRAFGRNIWPYSQSPMGQNAMSVTEERRIALLLHYCHTTPYFVLFRTYSVHMVLYFYVCRRVFPSAPVLPTHHPTVAESLSS